MLGSTALDIHKVGATLARMFASEPLQEQPGGRRCWVLGGVPASSQNGHTTVTCLMHPTLTMHRRKREQTDAHSSTHRL